MEIINLNHKIQSLESASEKRNFSVVLNTQTNQGDSGHRRQSRILRRSCSKSLNRSSSKQNKTFTTPYRGKTQRHNDQLSLECKMYRKMLLQSSIWEGQFIQHFQSVIKQADEDVQILIQNLEQMDEQLENAFSSNVKISKKSAILIQIEQYNQLIHRQNNLIFEMKNYQSQLQEVIKGLTHKLNSIYQQKNNSPNIILKNFQLENIVKNIVDKWKQQRATKQKSLMSQNKQLQDIIQQMIILMNKKKNNWNKDYRSVAH